MQSGFAKRTGHLAWGFAAFDFPAFVPDVFLPGEAGILPDTGLRLEIRAFFSGHRP